MSHPTDRFIVLCQRDAHDNGWHHESCDCDDWYNLWWELYDTKVTVDGKPSLVGTDHSEPEDKCLVRDFGWVLEAMNKLAKGEDP